MKSYSITKVSLVLACLSIPTFAQSWMTFDCNNPNFDVWAPWEDRCWKINSNSVFRFCSTDGHHFYTNDINEAKRLFYAHCAETNGFIDLTPCRAPGNWVIEGLGWTSTAYGGTVYRLKKGSNHLYTMNSSEVNSAISAGWSAEGDVGYLFISGTGPVYRLRNPSNGDYLYTTSLTERNNARRSGYVIETNLGYTSAN